MGGSICQSSEYCHFAFLTSRRLCAVRGTQARDRRQRACRSQKKKCFIYVFIYIYIYKFVYVFISFRQRNLGSRQALARLSLAKNIAKHSKTVVVYRFYIWLYRFYIQFVIACYSCFLQFLNWFFNMFLQFFKEGIASEVLIGFIEGIVKGLYTVFMFFSTTFCLRPLPSSEKS